MAPKILFVNKFHRPHSLLHTLEKRGYRILRASNGLKLISHLEVENPDLIVMDTKAVWPNSFSLCKALRKGKYKSIPVFFYSDGPCTEEESTRSYQCGATQYFSMPSQLDSFITKVREFAGTPGQY